MAAPYSTPARKAASLLEEAGIPHAKRVIRDHARADLLKSYAASIQIVGLKGPPAVRGGVIPMDLWERIICEGADDDVWTGGAVRLAASGLIGGHPGVIITDVSFHLAGLQRIIDAHCGRPSMSIAPARPTPPAPAGQVVVDQTIEVPVSVAPEQPKRRSPQTSAIRPGALLATIAETQAALGIGRTKVNELMKSGRLVRKTIDGGVRIEVASIMAIAGVSAERD
ncbi:MULTISPECIES: hypothetical protein [unclassified Sphingomonas]|uniref:hypothetical protein n=1 Tax=unclassified Sphingomonas TaxID=196159 RepID=UPI002269F41E|nr:MULTISPECIES: hypothetical protein [unclassified Sphingomonas]